MSNEDRWLERCEDRWAEEEFRTEDEQEQERRLWQDADDALDKWQDDRLEWGE